MPLRKPFYVMHGCAADNPYGVPHAELGRLCVENPASMVAQTVFGKLVPGDGLVFTGDLVRNLFDREAPAVLGATFEDAAAVEQADIARGLGYRTRFFGGVDLARKKDKTVIFVIDTGGVPDRPARIVYYRALTRVPWEVVYSEIGYAQWRFDASLLADSTGVGDVVLDALEGRSYCPKHHRTIPATGRCRDESDNEMACTPTDYHRVAVDAFLFSQKSKVELLTHLTQILGHGYDEQNAEDPFGLLRSPSIPMLEEELAFYKYDDKRLDTDHVMSLGLAAWHGLLDIPGVATFGSIYG